MSDILSKLNDEQREAVTSIDGKIRCISGAGTGKTRVLTHRYAYLVDTIGIDQNSILCLTFTNKAAKEMKDRIKTLVDGDYEYPYVCTIHSLCVKILKSEIQRIGWPRNFTIIDEPDQKDLANKVLAELKIDKDEMDAGKLLSDVAKYKASGSYIMSYFMGDTIETTNPVKKYILCQRQGYYLDFDDLTYVALHILQNYKEALDNWSFFEYIMIDEAQDCNKTDWDLINILSKKHGNLFQVGDDSQAIYFFRGSKPQLFIDYKSDKDIIVNRNYRSTQQILDVANKVISSSPKTIKKILVTDRKDGVKPTVYHALNDEDEAKWVCDTIKKGIDEGMKPTDFAVLYRASYQSRLIEQMLLKAKLPYVVWGGVRFYDRKEIKDVISYLRLVALDDDIAFERVINTPSRKFGMVSVDKVRACAAKYGISMYEALKSDKLDKSLRKETIINFINLIEEARVIANNGNISDILSLILDRTKLRKLYEEDSDSDRIDNLNEYIQSVKDYDKDRQGESNLQEYLSDIALFTNVERKSGSDTIKLMTIHQSKGLEFPTVFVIGLNEDVLPNARAVKEGEEGIIGETNLCYVAFTRAMNNLYISESQGRNPITQIDKSKSRFLIMLDKDMITEIGGKKHDDNYSYGVHNKVRFNPSNFRHVRKDLEVGNIVKHKVFGVGTIRAIDTERMVYTVDFNGKEKNVLGFVLEKG